MGLYGAYGLGFRALGFKDGGLRCSGLWGQDFRDVGFRDLTPNSGETYGT